MLDAGSSISSSKQNSETVRGSMTRTGGLEAALNRCIASDVPAPVGAVERSASNESRRERNRAGLRRRHLLNDEIRDDAEAFLQARQQLRIVRAAVTDQEWALLSDVGAGTSYGEIAAATSASSGALRVRVQRLRRKVITLAA